MCKYHLLILLFYCKDTPTKFMIDNRGGLDSGGNYIKNCRILEFDLDSVDLANPLDHVKWTGCNQVDQYEENLFVPVCEISQCVTKSGQFCKFPFKFAGRTYSECITLGNNETSWCSTRTDDFGNHIAGSEEDCETECSVNNCPTGYQKALPENTCYKVYNF